MRRSLRASWESLAEAYGISGRMLYTRCKQWDVAADGANTCPVTNVLDPSVKWSQVTRVVGGQGYLAVGESGSRAAAWSLDGVTWESYPVPDGGTWRSICSLSWASSLAMVGLTGTHRAAWGYFVDSWTPVVMPGDAKWTRVSPSESLQRVVAVSIGGSPSFAYSGDGQTWTAASTQLDSNWWDVCWSADQGLWVAVSSSATFPIATSADGDFWQGRACPGATHLFGVDYSPSQGLWVAVGGVEGVSGAWSTDAVTWTPMTMPTASTWRSVWWSEALQIWTAISAGPEDLVATSADGIHWDVLSSVPGGSLFYGVAAPSGSMSMMVSHGTSLGLIYSPLTYAPQAASGLPNLAQDESPLMPKPALSVMTWKLVGAQPSFQVTITTPEAVSLGGPQGWLDLYVGPKQRGVASSYRGPYTHVGLIHTLPGAFTTDAWTYPYAGGLRSGDRVPVKARYLGRGKRYGATANFVVTIE